MQWAQGGSGQGGVNSEGGLAAWGSPADHSGPQRALPLYPSSGPREDPPHRVPGGLGQAMLQSISGEMLHQGGSDEVAATNGSFTESVPEIQDRRQRWHRE